MSDENRLRHVDEGILHLHLTHVHTINQRSLHIRFLQIGPGQLGPVSYTHLDVYKRQGRGFYENIKKVVAFLLGTNIGEVLTVFVAMLVWRCV